MNFKKVALALSVLLSFVACSDEVESDVLARYDDDGVQYSPTRLSGRVDFLETMKLEAVKVVKVDGLLYPKDSFLVPVDTIYGYYRNEFTAMSSSYDVPYVKLVAIFPQGKNSKMEFAQYVRLSNRNTDIKLNLYGALISGRIETLMREKDYSFDSAEETAYKELEKALRISIDKEKNFRKINDMYGSGGFADFWSYLFLRHEISDSVFYRDFKEFRDVFAKKGKIDSSVEVRAADAWLSTFEVPSDSEYAYLFKSVSRDTAVGLRAMNISFFKDAYDLDFGGLDSEVMKKDSTTDYFVVIEDASSEYYGRRFAYEYVRSASLYTGWRLQSPLEDTLGLCRYYSQKYAENGKDSYLCRERTRKWEKLTERDSILKYKLGECGYSYHGSVFSYKDTLHICRCESNICHWEKVEEAKKGELKDFEVVSIEGTERFGICDVSAGEKKRLDSLYVQCYIYRWMEIDSLSFYLESCSSRNRDSIDKLPNNEYYKCTSDGWAPISVPSGHGDNCWNWNASVYKKYDGKYYYCDGHAWKETSEESVYAPILNGDPCDENHESDVKTYGDESFVCRLVAKDYYVWLPFKDEKDK